MCSTGSRSIEDDGWEIWYNDLFAIGVFDRRILLSRNMESETPVTGRSIQECFDTHVILYEMILNELDNERRFSDTAISQDCDLVLVTVVRSRGKLDELYKRLFNIHTRLRTSGKYGDIISLRPGVCLLVGDLTLRLQVRFVGAQDDRNIACAFEAD